jgi:hypothetical protein
MMRPTAQLCQQCAGFDFSLITKSNRRNSIDEITLDIVWDTLVPDRCDFCQLVSHCICNSRGISVPFHSNIRGVSYGQELQIYIKEGETTKRLDYGIRQCNKNTAINSSQLAQQSARFNPTEIKAWLEECDRHQCLPDDHFEHALPEGFRLIDVHRNCIVQPKEFVKYCALSYVWGSVEQPLLTSCNALESPNALDALKLPKTTTDAMALCRDIDCRYLWVDSLCIVQDSKEVKHNQISAMADVYSQSFLAVIAATGDDANAGLPPYGSLGRKFPISYLVRHIPAGSFVASFSPSIAAEAVGRSKWASRGWTLQEYALSRRVMFFTGTYTFLRCEKSLSCEDFGLGFSGCSGKRQKWDVPMPPFYRRSPDPSRSYPSIYGYLLCQYMRRNLTYEQDILEAFTGILTRIEGEIGKHIWGLPSKEFGVALQWKTDQPFPSDQRYGFPSWSWAGWIHNQHLLSPNNILYDLYEGLDEKTTNMSVITCYMVQDDRVPQMVQECNLERICSLFVETKKRYEICDDVTEACGIESQLRRLFVTPPDLLRSVCTNWQSPSKSPLSQHLFIWVSCASLCVDKTPIISMGLEAWEFPVRIKKDAAPVGSVNLRPEWRKMETNDYMEFIVSTVGVHSPDANDALRTAELKFRLILVQQLYDTKPPVCRRIQVSNISISLRDWISADPECRLIVLV